MVTSGTFANAQLFLEYRPFIEDGRILGRQSRASNGSSDEHASSTCQANFTKSEFHRESPTVLVDHAAAARASRSTTTNGGDVPTIATNVDLNNPANFVWDGGRVNIQDELRETETKGVRGNLTLGRQDASTCSVGGAYDDISRRIQRVRQQPGLAERGLRQQRRASSCPARTAQPPCHGANTPGAAPPALRPIRATAPASPPGAAGAAHLPRLADPAGRARRAT